MQINIFNLELESVNFKQDTNNLSYLDVYTPDELSYMVIIIFNRFRLTLWRRNPL